MLESDDDGDVAGGGLFDRVAPLGEHAKELGHVFLEVAADVDDTRAGLERARVDADEVQIAVRVGDDLEHQGRQRFVGIALAANDPVRLLRIVAFHGRPIQRGRQICTYGVEHGLHADVAQRRAAQDRLALAGDGPLAQCRHDFFVVDRLALDVLVHQVVVEFGGALFQQMAILDRGIAQFVGNLSHFEFGFLTFAGIDQGLHRDQIDHSTKRVLLTDGDLHGDRIGGQAHTDGGEGVKEIGADLVHLVDEADARHVVLVRLAPDSFRLRLDALFRVEDDHRPVEHAQTAFDLGREVDVPGRVDQVEREVLPVQRDRGAVDGDAALLLLNVEVGDGGSVVDIAHLVRGAAVVEHALGGGGLAGVDVRGDADISQFG